MNILRRVERVEAAIAVCGIPKEEQIQIIKGRMEQGRFIPDAPEDSVERRKERLTRRYGSTDGAVFVNLVDWFG